MSNIENISNEIMMFMREKYILDEIGDGKNELKFKQGQKTILTIYTHDDRITFVIIFGSKEYKRFKLQIDEFEDNIPDFHNQGKWVIIDVTTAEQLDDIKKLVEMKKKPNRNRKQFL